MPFRAITRWLAPAPTRNTKRVCLLAEQLEGREVPAVVLSSIANSDFSNDKPLFIPVTNTAAVNGSTTYTATSDNASVTVDLLPAGQTWRIDVSGIDNTGQAFSGSITMRLFADAAPLAVQRVIDLTASGFYVGKTFFRTQDNFVIQGGSSNNTASDPGTVANIADEYNKDFTFNSPGILASANATDDANGTQFFITDIDLPVAGATPTSQTRPQFLNFNHTIFGQVTSGFDIFSKIIQGSVRTGTTDQAANPAVINAASIINDNANGVLRIRANTGFTGSANITVTGVDGDNAAQSKTFAATAITDPTDDRPFLPSIPDISVTSGAQSITVLPTVNLDGDSANLTYRVGVPGNLFGTPANVVANVNNTTGELTITANSGFTGTVDLLVGVRDTTDRVGGLNSAGNFDTQAVRVNVREAGPATVVLSGSTSTPQASRTVLLTANVTGENTANGTVRFLDGTTVLGSTTVLDGRALLNASFSTVGAHAITAEFTPVSGTSSTATSNSTSLNVVAGTAPVPLTVTQILPGNPSLVVAAKADGTQQFSVNAFPDFTGGVRVAVADVNNDGQQDVIAVPRFGGGPVIQIYNGADGALLRSVQIFEDTFRGGLYIDAKDGLGKGYSQILVGAGFTGGPRVSYYDFVQDAVVLNYFAYDSTLRGGVTVSLSDLRGGDQFQILTAPGTGGGPAINVYTARREDGFPIPQQLGAFFAGAATDQTGRRVAATALSNGLRNIQVFDFDETDVTGDEFSPTVQGIFPAT